MIKNLLFNKTKMVFLRNYAASVYSFLLKDVETNQVKEQFNLFNLMARGIQGYIVE